MEKRKERNNKKVTLKKIISSLKRGLLAVICLCFVILAYHGMKVRKDPEFIPSVFGHTYLNVLSGSMEPEISTYDLTIGKKVKDSNTLSVGDIITFRDGDMLVTHRIIEIIDGNVYRTKGDSNAFADENLVERSNVISLIKYKIPYGGYVVAKFQDFSFLALVWLILIYSIIKELIKELKKEKLIKSAIQ